VPACSCSWTRGRAVPAGRTGGWPKVLGCGHRTVERIRERFVAEGLDAALTAKARATPPRQPVLDGAAEAELVSLACSATPDGRKAWTLRMLAEKLVELEVVEAASRETVRRTLKKLAEAAPAAAVVPAGRAERRVRRPDGGRARRVPPAV